MTSYLREREDISCFVQYNLALIKLLQLKLKPNC